jgi:uncharacterized membrane protein YphA (DoxX/SURF4 family)
VRSRRILPWIGLAIRLGAAAIWIIAGAAKIGDLQHFHAQVDAYKLLPHALEAPFAYALPFVEVVVGIYLVIGLLVRPAAIVACVLMAMFIVAMSQAWTRGLSIDCGCFGALARHKVGLWTVLRDAALGIPSLILAIWPARFASLDQLLLGRPDRFAQPLRSEARSAV